MNKSLVMAFALITCNVFTMDKMEKDEPISPIIQTKKVKKVKRSSKKIDEDAERAPKLKLRDSLEKIVKRLGSSEEILNHLREDQDIA